jgi:hypothetical protein
VLWLIAAIVALASAGIVLWVIHVLIRDGLLLRAGMRPA